jgi:hypothetical protein
MFIVDDLDQSEALSSFDLNNNEKLKNKTIHAPDTSYAFRNAEKSFMSDLLTKTKSGISSKITDSLGQYFLSKKNDPFFDKENFLQK